MLNLKVMIEAGVLPPTAARRMGRTGGSSQMTAGSAGSPSAGGALQPVAPALLVRVVIPPMTKVLNPVFVKFAGRKHFPVAAQIHHVGIRSAKAYVTPRPARLHGDVIVVALTSSNQSDWARNVRGFGTESSRCQPELRHRGSDGAD